MCFSLFIYKIFQVFDWYDASCEYLFSFVLCFDGGAIIVCNYDSSNSSVCVYFNNNGVSL